MFYIMIILCLEAKGSKQLLPPIQLDIKNYNFKGLLKTVTFFTA